MLALHLTQYACGMAFQLGAFSGLVVFETHVEHGNTVRNSIKKEPNLEAFFYN